jgi:hypothetical protein
VTERTQSLDKRVRELRLINSIQAGMVSHLSFDAIIDEVGLQLEAHLQKPDNLGIVLFMDTENQLMHLEYFIGQWQTLSQLFHPLRTGD